MTVLLTIQKAERANGNGKTELNLGPLHVTGWGVSIVGIGYLMCKAKGLLP